MTFSHIDIENFLSFYERCDIAFGATTLVLGQNNTGKSKLFDAINWCMFGRAYHTETETWRETQQWKLNGLDLINRRALLESSDGGEVIGLVRLTVDADELGVYEIERSLTTLATSDGWQPCTSGPGKSPAIFSVPR